MTAPPQPGAGAAAGSGGRPRYGEPRPTSLPYLDRNMYRSHADVYAHLTDFAHDVLRLQMMALGERRYFFTNTGDVIEVTDPLEPVVVSRKAYPRGHLALAYNRALGRWILIVGARVAGTNPSARNPDGKYGDPALVRRSMEQPGLRGVRIYDASDPTRVTLLAEWSCDQGDPARALQTGGGGADVYYDGGRYAYLQASPDESYTVLESPWRHYTSGLQIIDVADPSAPRFVSNWWVPGQRAGEEVEARRWREYGDRGSSNHLHGSLTMLERPEEGGRYAYSCWGSFGLFIHDISDVRAPRLVGRFSPPRPPGAIPFHSVDILKLHRGFVVTTPEPLFPDGAEPFHPSCVVDVRDPANPREIAQLPVPQPPPDAPYADFLDKRGRFGPHNPPYLNSPGRAHPDFTAYAYFNAGLQMYDLRDPERPAICGYFIPPQGGRYADSASHARDVDVIFVEWDRRLIWVGSLTGLYLVGTPHLGAPVLKPMAVSEWAVPGINAGHR